MNKQTTTSSFKLQKLIADTGLMSRRKAEQVIADGDVTVNGKTAEIGQRANLTDRIEVYGKPINGSQRQGPARLWLYYKPEGEICSRNGQGHKTIFESLGELGQDRLLSIGRLDISSSGLLLLTNDGDIANAIMHPKKKLLRKYRVRINGYLTDSQIEQLKAGIEDDGELLQFASCDCDKNSKADSYNQWVTVGLYQGRNREIRRAFEQLGFSISRLLRIQYGPYRLPKGMRSRQLCEVEIHNNFYPRA